MADDDEIPPGEYRFECTRCSACCRGEPGYVFLTPSDLVALSAFFGMDGEAFLSEYCRIVPSSVPIYSLREKPNYDCILWDGGCRAYGARPVQCRTYPFWESVVKSADSWNDEASHCPGIGKGRARSADEVRALILERRREDPVGPEEP
jgi:Fe-S-cluster containining protein